MSKSGKVADLASAAGRDLPVSPKTAAVLNSIRAELAEQYRDSFNEMLRVIERQAAAIDRLQNLMEAFIEASDPQILARFNAPPMRVAEDGENPDVTTAVVVPDPVGAGFKLTQAGLARALGLAQPTVSVLTRALGLRDDATCAVVVRHSGGQPIVNYHPRAVERFIELLRSPPDTLTDSERRARVRALRDVERRG